MNCKLLLYGALCALSGCRSEDPQALPISLLYTEPEVSKTDARAANDQAAVYASVDGTKNFFLEAAKFTVGSDGRTLSATPAAYYPDPKQAINFYAHIPYFSGSFSVPADQTTPAALKSADLLWASGSSMPNAAPVPLQFKHVLARLVVSCSQTPSKIIVPNVFSGGTLDPLTGLFANSTQSEVSTLSNELILPPQTLTRLVLTVSGVDYLFDGVIALEADKTTTVHLTLNPATKTASLAGSSVTKWTAAATNGNTMQSVTNLITLHWPTTSPQASTVDRMVLTIWDQTTNTTGEYTVSSGISFADRAFAVPFSSGALCYPYTIKSIRYYSGASEVLPTTVNIFWGATVYKSGVSTVGVLRNPINPPLPSDYVKIGPLYWAKGNLVATSSTASGNNGCKVGNQYDCGLYFQFGSLIGWKGGSTGTGTGYNPNTGNGTQWWGGGGNPGSSIFATDAMVWPTSLASTPSAWSGNVEQATEANAFKKWYFDFSGTSQIGSINYSTSSDIRSYTHPTLGALKDGGMASLGIGDPCTYYLGANWRLPTIAECLSLFDNVANNTPWPTANWNWTTATYNGALRSGSTLYFPASGSRYSPSGSFYYVTDYGFGWSSSVDSALYGYFLNFYSRVVAPQNYGFRSSGYPVRCVSAAP